MTGKEKEFFKHKVYSLVLKRVDESVLRLAASIKELQASANEETKSSVGDKYETGRAMAQLEIEKLTQQLNEHSRSRNMIMVAKPAGLNELAQLGSMVETDNGIFYLVTNGGEFIVDEKKVQCISLQSPLGKLLLGKGTGAEFVLNGRKILVRLVY
jgi:transcription elongation GreA/GreB family factor